MDNMEVIMRKNSIKNTRINGEVQKVLSTLISREIKDPRINPMTSVVAVEVAPDLKTAKVYISVLGDEESKENTRKGLKSAASFMRGQLAKTLNLRNTPELTFIIDNSIEYGVNMSRLIDEVNRNSSHQDEDLIEEENDDEDDTEDETEGEEE
jgi:ribosome-binding factor A